MAYEFKKLSEVNALEEIPENTSILGENNGEIVRLPSNGLGGGADMVIVFDEKFKLATIENITIKEGTIANVIKKLKNHEIVSVAIINTNDNWGSYSNQPTCCMAYQVMQAGENNCICIKWQHTDEEIIAYTDMRYYSLTLSDEDGVADVGSYYKDNV